MAKTQNMSITARVCCHVYLYIDIPTFRPPKHCPISLVTTDLFSYTLMSSFQEYYKNAIMHVAFQGWLFFTQLTSPQTHLGLVILLQLYDKSFMQINWFLFTLFQYCFSYFSSFGFPCKLQDNFFSVSAENLAILIGAALNLYISLRRNGIFTLLHLPVHEHCMYYLGIL